MAVKISPPKKGAPSEPPGWGPTGPFLGNPLLGGNTKNPGEISFQKPKTPAGVFNPEQINRKVPLETHKFFPAQSPIGETRLPKAPLLNQLDFPPWGPWPWPSP